MEVRAGGPRALVLVAAILLVGFAPLLSVPTVSAGLRTPVKTIPLAGEALDIDVDPARPLAYLPSRSNGSVLVFSLVTLEIVDEIPVGADPRRMDLDPATDRLYVALGGGPGVAVVDLASRSVEAVWSIGSGASDVAVSPLGRVYVTRTNVWPLHAAILDSTTGALVGNITNANPMSDSAAIEISADGRYIYLGQRGMTTSYLYKLDATTDTPALLARADTLGSNLQDMDLSPDGSTLYYACASLPEIQVVRTLNLMASGGLPTGGSPSAVAASEDGTVVLGGKADPSDHTFYTFDPSTRERIDYFRTPEEVYGVGIDPSGQTLLALVSDSRSAPFSLSVFSMSSPVNEPPVAAFTVSPAPRYAGVPVTFDASSSQDPERAPLTYAWQFGDGAQGTGETVTHVYATAWDFTVTLTVTDNVGQTDAVSQSVPVVDPPDVPPTAAFTYAPTRVTIGDPVTFDGSASSDSYRPILWWDWTFGDGSQATGQIVTHAYANPGTHAVRLTVTNSIGSAGSVQVPVTVDSVGPIDLVPFSHPSGFRVPVPAAWARRVDLPIEDGAIELVVTGPPRFGVQTHVIVDTDRDPTVRESDAYLLDLVDQAVAANPQASIVGAPSLRRMSGHAAVVFVLQYPGGLVQKIAVVVSEAHERYWILVLAAASGYFPHIDPTFEAMLAGFEITALGISQAASRSIGAGFFAAAIVAGIAVALLHRRKRHSAPAIPLSASIATPGMARCPACGGVGEPGARFCIHCGGLLTREPPLPPG